MRYPVSVEYATRLSFCFLMQTTLFDPIHGPLARQAKS
jgi:hypothetical protein